MAADAARLYCRELPAARLPKAKGMAEVKMI
jgi:hypothetical protein